MQYHLLCQTYYSVTHAQEVVLAVVICLATPAKPHRQLSPLQQTADTATVVGDTTGWRQLAYATDSQEAIQMEASQEQNFVLEIAGQTLPIVPSVTDTKRNTSFSFNAFSQLKFGWDYYNPKTLKCLKSQGLLYSSPSTPQILPDEVISNLHSLSSCNLRPRKASTAAAS